MSDEETTSVPVRWAFYTDENRSDQCWSFSIGGGIGWSIVEEALDPDVSRRTLEAE